MASVVWVTTWDHALKHTVMNHMGGYNAFGARFIRDQFSVHICNVITQGYFGRAQWPAMD